MKYFWAYVIMVGAALCWVGCSSKTISSLGTPPAGEPHSISLVMTNAPTSETIIVKGQMVEKCTGEGCWFYVKDATGRIKVDTKAAGFNVRKINLKSEVVVAGILRQEGKETVLDATGLKIAQGAD